MCLAGDGGGNGRLKNLRPGVDDRAGDGDTPDGNGLEIPVGYGLDHGLEDLAGVCLTVVVVPPLTVVADDGSGD